MGANASRTWRERLGMGFWDFAGERLERHVTAWAIFAFSITWARFFVTFNTGSFWTDLVSGFLVTALIALVYGVACLLILPLLPLLLLALVSIALEAWWRVRHDQPYALPPITVLDASPSWEAPAPKRRGGFLIPLVIGIWIGSAWGDD